MSTAIARPLGPLCSRCFLPPHAVSPHPSLRCSQRSTTHSRRFLHRQQHPQALRWPTNPNPTPYDIFNIHKDAAYTKSRFYELVKLYHPDCHHRAHSHLTAAVRTERYRLIVLANAILSDPAKRHAYDTCGVGWTHHHPTPNEAYDAWRQRKDTPAANATWEDWERWHDNKSGNTQRPVYMSHGSFASLIVMFISVGVVAQTYRADSLAKERMMLMHRRQEVLAEETGRRAEASMTMGRGARVEMFSRDRENALYEYKPEKWDTESTRQR